MGRVKGKQTNKTVHFLQTHVFICSVNKMMINNKWQADEQVTGSKQQTERKGRKKGKMEEKIQVKNEENVRGTDKGRGKKQNTLKAVAYELGDEFPDKWFLNFSKHKTNLRTFLKHKFLLHTS